MEDLGVNAAAIQELLASAEVGDRLRGINQLRTLPPEAAFALIRPLSQDENARVRYAAVSQIAVLGQVNPPQAHELLRNRLLHDSETDVRAAAADAMAALRLPFALEDLAMAYHSTSDWLLQFSIIAALGALGNPAAVGLLTEALKSPQELVKLAAIGSLGELKQPESIEHLRQFVEYPDWQLRHRLAIALGQIGTPEARPLLEQLATDSAAAVTEAARTSLAQLTA
ncbi:MAG: HEAT repeat domain-containing protein [Thermosynechococcus sp. Uc]|uniref:HEAT repeat domain-containing protein n=1 Tax=Thermosynechococcus sp. Uc TaxID=3034853 RepID=UPI0019E6D536|nr:HEAT repeat domain-containing protein [Thermosynechococcus sp. Uc]MDM7325801.1 HEAT repeat domain-containing protein [Thermosynechococcus sp. Uc]HIK25507.1 HEAT repeat domain-containing protein [Thermosynechococcus sp. M46_R2017_013]